MCVKTDRLNNRVIDTRWSTEDDFMYHLKQKLYCCTCYFGADAILLCQRIQNFANGYIINDCLNYYYLNIAIVFSDDVPDCMDIVPITAYRLKPWGEGTQIFLSPTSSTYYKRCQSSVYAVCYSDLAFVLVRDNIVFI